MANYAFQSLIDFTRTSAATYVDSTGKIVPTPASRNLLTYTQEFDNAAWTKTAATVYPFNPATATQGPELVVNGDFSGGTTTGWTAVDANLTVSSGKLRVENSGAAAGYAYQAFTTVIGRTYRFYAEVTGVDATNYPRIGVGNSINSSTLLLFQLATPQTTQVFTGYFTATATTTYINALTNTGGAGVAPLFDNISVKELSGGLIAAPDGTFTADALIENTATSAHHVSETVTGTAVGTIYTASVYAKPNGRNWIILEMLGTSTYASFNVATGAVGTLVGSPTATITSVGNGWYRCSITKTIGAAITSFRVYLASADNTDTYAGNGTSGVYLWGAQLEAVPDANLTLGSELVTNGDFSGGTTGWLTAGSPSFSVTSGIASVTRTTFGDIAYQAVTCVIGRTYKVTGTVVSGATARIGFSSAAVGGAGEVVNSGSAGTYSTLVVANATTMYVVLTTSTNGTSATFDNISVKEVTAITGMPTDYTRNNGGVYPPRFDYDPVTLAPRGLLVEEQRTNLFTYSEQFDNAVWTTSGLLAFGSGSTVNATAAPDGAVTADLLTEDTSNGFHRVFRAFNLAANAPAAFSFFVKRSSGTRNIFVIVQLATDSLYCRINLATGAIIEQGIGGTASGLTVSVKQYANSFYRVEVSGVVSTTATTLYSQVYLNNTSTADGPAAPSYTGDGTSGLYIWGAQLEAGSFATSYIPTVASQVTRSADVATITGANFSQFYNQSEGTFVVEADTLLPSTVSGWSVAVNDGTSSNRMLVRYLSGNVEQLVQTGGSVVAQQGVAYVVNTPDKVATAYKANDFAFTRNGATVLADTSGALPTVNQMLVGGGSTASLNGHIRSVKYYPTRLSNAQLQALTA